jgi:hypothetical protein
MAEILADEEKDALFEISDERTSLERKVSG